MTEKLDSSDMISIFINKVEIKVDYNLIMFNIVSDSVSNLSTKGLVVETTFIKDLRVRKQVASIIKTVLGASIDKTTGVINGGNYYDMYLDIARMTPSIHHAVSLYEVAHAMNLELLRVFELVLADRILKWLWVCNGSITKFVTDVFPVRFSKRSGLTTEDVEEMAIDSSIDVKTKYYFAHIHLDDTFDAPTFRVVEAFIKRVMMIVLDDITYVELYPATETELLDLIGKKQTPIMRDLYVQKLARLQKKIN